MLPSATPAFFAISGVVVPWYPCVVKSSSAARTRRWCVRSAWLIGRESNVRGGAAPGFLPVPPLTSFPAARRRGRRRRLVGNANAGVGLGGGGLRVRGGSAAAARGGQVHAGASPAGAPARL